MSIINLILKRDLACQDSKACIGLGPLTRKLHFFFQTKVFNFQYLVLFV